MAGTEGTQGRTPPGQPSIDWERAEHSPEFQELVQARSRFVLPATIFYLAWYIAFILLAGYAEGFMGETFLIDGLTVGYTLALTQFVMVFVLGLMYLRRAENVFDPLSDRAVERALEGTGFELDGAGTKPSAAVDGGAVSSPEASREARR